jgi:hypothetical protein
MGRFNTSLIPDYTPVESPPPIFTSLTLSGFLTVVEENTMSVLNPDKYPFAIIYSAAFKNVSRQTLEIDGSRVPPEYTWGLIRQDRFLTLEQVNHKGAATDALIEGGYISRSIAIPLIPNGDLYLQSDEGSWFRVWAVNIESIGTSDPKLSGIAPRLERVTEPPANAEINYSLSIPGNIPIVLDMGDGSAMTLKFDFSKEAPIYSKSSIAGRLLPLESPIAVPNTSLLLIQSKTSNPLGMRIFLTAEGHVTFVRVLPSEGGQLIFESVAFEVPQL